MPYNKLLKNYIFLNTVLDSTQDFIFLVDIETEKLIYANTYACKILEYSLNELINIPIPNWRQPLYGNESYKSHLIQLESKKNMRSLGLLTSKSGKKTPVESTLQIVTLDNKDYNFVIARDISEQIELQNIKENQFITETLNKINDAAFLANRKGKLVFVNSAACNSLNYTKDELINLNVLDVDPTINDEIWDNIWKELETKGSIQIEAKHKRKDGTTFTVEVVASLIKIGNTNYNFGIVRDIEDRKQQEQKMIQKNHELELLFNNAQIGLMYIKGERILIKANPRLATILGYESSDEMIGLSMLSLHLSEENFIEFGKKNFYSLTKGTNLNIDYPLKRKDGSSVWVTLSGKALDKNIPADLSFGVLWSVQDISERKKYQQEIENQHRKYKSFIDNSSDAIFIANMNAKALEVSKKFCEILGYTQEEALNLHIWDIEANHPKELILKNIQNIKNEPLYLKSKYKTKQNQIIDVSITASYIENDGIGYIYTSFRDNTKETLLEQITLQQKEEFETIFKTIKDGIAVVDLDTRFVKFNKAFSDLLGFSEEELLKKKCSDLTLEEDREKNEKAINEAIEKGFVENMEKRCVNKSGKQFTVHISIALLPDNKHLILSIRDVSSIKLFEEQSKMASMGEMIGNIAHQWRQPLSIISASASGMKMRSDFGQDVSKEDISEFSDLIVMQTKYLSDTIDNFRDFLKGDKRHIKIKISDIFEYTLSLVKATISNNFITLITDIDDSLYINASKNELSEAFINLINNAKDILKEHVKNQNDRLIFIIAKRTENKKVEIIFKDSGGGISENIINRVFEPYFTSKHQSIGTGLGLSMADKIIRERHEGLITVTNEEFLHNGKKYKGACFRIILKEEL